MPNLAWPNLVTHDVLGTEVVTDLTGNPYFGPTGSGSLAQNITEQSVSNFDVRGYSQVQVLWEGAFANAVTVQLGIRVASSAAADSFSLGAYTTSVANGGPVLIQTGCGVQEWGASTYALFPHVFTTLRPAFFRVGTSISGATGTITAGRITVYGMR